MRTTAYFLSAAALAAAVLVVTASRLFAAEPIQAATSPGRVIRVSGTAVVYGKPDYATIELGVTKVAPKVIDAKSVCDSAMKNVVDSLHKAGVAPEDIQTVAYQIYPVQPKPGMAREWKVVNHVSVRVRRVSSVGSVLDAAIAHGATDVSQVQFGIEKVLALRSKARAEAVAVAKQKAEELAQLTGVHVGAPMTISDNTYEGYYAQSANSYVDTGVEAAMPATVMSAGQLAINSRADVEFAIRD